VVSAVGPAAAAEPLDVMSAERPMILTKGDAFVKTKWIIAVAVALLFVGGKCQAQVQPYTGKDVPTVAAFFSWLEQNTYNRTINNNINLPPNDKGLVTAAMKTYRAETDKILGAFNQNPQGQWPNAAEYAMVQKLYDDLHAAFAADSITAFDVFLENHKDNIQLSPYDLSLGKLAELNLKKAQENVWASSEPMPGMLHQGGMIANYTVTNTSGAGANAMQDTFVTNGALGSPWVTIEGQGFTVSNGTAQNASTTNTTAYQSNTNGSGTHQTSSMLVDTFPTGIDAFTVRVYQATNNPNTYYGARLYLYNGAQYVALWKVINNAATLLGSSPVALTNGGESEVTLHVTPTNPQELDVFVDDVDLISSNDSSLTSGYSSIHADGNSGKIAGWWGGNGDMTVTMNSTLTGNTIGTIPHQYPGCNTWPCHTGKMDIVFNGVDNVVTGNPVPPQTGITVQNIQAYDILPGWGCTGILPCWPQDVLETNGSVLCSVVGSFFSAWFNGGGSITELEEAVTMSQIGANQPPVVKLVNWTDNRCQPPDYNPTSYYKHPYKPTNPSPTVPSWAHYSKSRTTCGRQPPSVKWICGNSPNLGVFGQFYSPWAFKFLTDNQASLNELRYGDGFKFDSSNWDINEGIPTYCNGIWDDPLN
jgi:hypothetical protein